jgi:hypothetical protein
MSLPGILRIETHIARSIGRNSAACHRENPIRGHPLKLRAASFLVLGQPDVVDLGQLVQPVAISSSGQPSAKPSPTLRGQSPQM